MHGITHIYRQHAIEKQISSESWQHSQSNYANGSIHSSTTKQSVTVIAATAPTAGTVGAQRMSSMSSGSSTSSTNSKSPNWSQDKVLEKLQQASSPQPVPNSLQSISNHFPNSPNYSNAYPKGSCDSYSSSFKRTPSSKRSLFNERSHSPGFYNSIRRASVDAYGSPPIQAGFFPHDLDDIHENHTDHQYFTHTGNYQTQRPTINSIFHRVNAANSLDDYNSHQHQFLTQRSCDSTERHSFRSRFDNSSFIKSLSNTSQNSDENASPKDGKIKHGHHTHSIQEMFKHLGKKVHIWPRKSHGNSSGGTSPCNDAQENFRLRSKSLDVNVMNRSKRILND